MGSHRWPTQFHSSLRSPWSIGRTAGSLFSTARISQCRRQSLRACFLIGRDRRPQRQGSPHRRRRSRVRFSSTPACRIPHLWQNCVPRESLSHRLHQVECLESIKSVAKREALPCATTLRPPNRLHAGPPETVEKDQRGIFSSKRPAADITESCASVRISEWEAARLGG